MRSLFSDGKIFGIDGVYNSQNGRIWDVDRAEAHKKGGVKHWKSFSQKAMVWLGVSLKEISPLVIFEDDTVDHTACIETVLPEALKYGEKVFGDNRTSQQDGARPQLFNV